MAKNTVIEGDYKGKCIIRVNGSVFISTGFFKTLELSKSNVANYEILNEDKRKSATSGATRALVGGALLGGIGLLAGALSAKNKGEYLITIQFTDGKKSLLNVDDKIYKTLISKCFN